GSRYQNLAKIVRPSNRDATGEGRSRSFGPSWGHTTMPSEKAPATTLAEAVARYRERGGNRALDSKVLEHLGGIDVAEIDRDFLLEWGRKLYPKLTIAERMEHFVEPLAEILDLPPAEPKTAAWWAERKLERDAAYEPELVRVYEWLKPPSYPLAEALIQANTERYLAGRLMGAAPRDVSADNGPLPGARQLGNRHAAPRHDAREAPRAGTEGGKLLCGRHGLGVLALGTSRAGIFAADGRRDADPLRLRGIAPAALRLRVRPIRLSRLPAR